MINDVLFISYQSDNHGGKLLTFKAKKSLPLAFSQTVSQRKNLDLDLDSRFSLLIYRAWNSSVCSGFPWLLFLWLVWYCSLEL